MDREESREKVCNILKKAPENWVDFLALEIEMAYQKGWLNGQADLFKKDGQNDEKS